jgi:TrmH family RNA methyltransferase
VIGVASATQEVIQSTSNPRVREYRECVAKGIPGQVALEGVRLVGDALAAGLRLSAVYVTDTALADGDIRSIVETARRAGSSVYLVSDRVGHSMGATVNPQGLFALAGWSPRTGREVLEQVERHTQRASFVVLLDGLQDPGNVGTIVRTAAALGAEAVIAGAGSADPANPKVVRASMGAVFRIPVAREASLPRLMAWAAGRGWTAFATHVDPAGSTRVDELRWPPSAGVADTSSSASGEPPRALVVIGSEAHGVSSECLRQCAGAVHVPMARQVESLNAATAAAIVMYELSRNAGGFRG